MAMVSSMTRLVALAGALFGATPITLAQDKDKPVTPPDSYRVVMENDRVRMIEININPHSKINVESQAGRERFLYMLSDGALILAPPGKAPYEFALHAGETAVFPAVSPTVVERILMAQKIIVTSGTLLSIGDRRRSQVVDTCISQNEWPLDDAGSWPPRLRCRLGRTPLKVEQAVRQNASCRDAALSLR